MRIIDVREQNARLFTNISIETGAACNRRCAFCPQSVNPRPDEWMPAEVYYRIIDQLAAVKYKARITLTAYNEPTRDPRLMEFIGYTRLVLPRSWLLFNTNGDYFKTSEDIAQYFDAGLNGMQINVYSSADGSGNPDKIARGIARAEKRYAELKAMVAKIPWLEDKGIYLQGKPDETRCQVVPKWDLQPESAADHRNTITAKRHGTSLRNHISNRAGDIPDFVPALEEPLNKMCTRPFRAFMVNWKGDAYLCCNDYYTQANLGNVMERDIVEMFNDERMHAYRIKLRHKDRRIFLCDKCDYVGGFYQGAITHVTLGDERDAEIVEADMRTVEAAGFVPLSRVGIKS